MSTKNSIIEQDLQLASKLADTLGALLPVARRETVPIEVFLAATIHFLKYGTAWRAMDGLFPYMDGRGVERPVKWQTLYRMSDRWSGKGVIDAVFVHIRDLVYQGEPVQANVDSSCFKAAPGASEGGDESTIGGNCGGRNTKLHVATSNGSFPYSILLTKGQVNDFKAGIQLLTPMLEDLKNRGIKPFSSLAADKAYVGEEMRRLLEEHGLGMVIPPKSNMKDPWEYDKGKYKERAIVENFFNRLKRYRHLLCRQERKTFMFRAFIQLACILNYLQAKETPAAGRWKQN